MKILNAMIVIWKTRFSKTKDSLNITARIVFFCMVPVVNDFSVDAE